MKRHLAIGIISLQVFTLALLAFIGHRVYTTEHVVVNTQQALASTIAFMDELDAQQKEEAELMRPLMVGEKAPPFSLYDENEKKITLGDYQGKKVLLIFGEENCSYCTNYYPVLNDFSEQRPDIEVVIMQYESTPKQNKVYKEKMNLLPKLLAATTDELVRYKIHTTPTSVLIDEEGYILGTRTETTDLPQLHTFVDPNKANSSKHHMSMHDN